MKQILIMLIVLSLTSSVAFAGSIITLKDFSESPSQIIDVPKGDAVYIEYKQGRHVFLLNDILPKTGTIETTTTVYQRSYNDSSIQQFSLFINVRQGNNIKLDFDKDRVTDFEIIYIRRYFDAATIEFRAINASDMNIIHPNRIDPPKNQTNNSSNTQNSVINPMVGVSISLGIILIGFLVYWLINKKKTVSK